MATVQYAIPAPFRVSPAADASDGLYKLLSRSALHTQHGLVYTTTAHISSAGLPPTYISKDDKHVDDDVVDGSCCPRRAGARGVPPSLHTLQTSAGVARGSGPRAAQRHGGARPRQHAAVQWGTAGLSPRVPRVRRSTQRGGLCGRRRQLPAPQRPAGRPGRDPPQRGRQRGGRQCGRQHQAGARHPLCPRRGQHGASLRQGAGQCGCHLHRASALVYTHTL